MLQPVLGLVVVCGSENVAAGKGEEAVFEHYAEVVEEVVAYLGGDEPGVGGNYA